MPETDGGIVHRFTSFGKGSWKIYSDDVEVSSGNACFRRLLEVHPIHEEMDKVATLLNRMVAEGSPRETELPEGLWNTIVFDSVPRKSGLNTHKFSALKGPEGREVFEAYAESRTPAAYRIFWFYGPEKHEITIIAITAHP